MANEFDVLLKQLEVLEKIVITRPVYVDEEDQKTAIRIIQKFQYVGEQIMGDKFENISNSTIVNRSTLNNALNKLTAEYDDAFKKSLEEVADYIDGAKHIKSAELFDGFSKELNSNQANKSILSALWSGLVKALPDTSKIAASIATISKLLG